MHTYIHPITGKELPSVTTILEDTMPLESRAQIDRWYATKSNSHFKNAESQRRGLAVDAWAKGYLLGKSIEIDWLFMPYCQRLIPLLDSLRSRCDALLVDEFVWTDRYGGTLDVAYCLNGVWTIADIKTKSHLYLPAIENHKLQGIAYKEALEQKGYEVGAIEIFAAMKNQCQVFRIDQSPELQALQAIWLSRLNQFSHHASTIPTVPA